MDLKNTVEAILMAAGQPLTLDRIIALFVEGSAPEKAALVEVLQQLQQDYSERGIELVEIASGWRIQARAQYGQHIAYLWQEKPARYSRAVLETLALIAYRQPITRGQIEEVRGVAVSSNIVKGLMERGWIKVIGHKDVPGKPALLATTKQFLDDFSLKKLTDLPSLQELIDLEDKGKQIQTELTLVETDASANDAESDVAETVVSETAAEHVAETVVSETAAEHVAEAVVGETTAENMNDAVINETVADEHSPHHNVDEEQIIADAEIIDIAQALESPVYHQEAVVLDEQAVEDVLEEIEEI